jgi:hypothetical protein
MTSSYSTISALQRAVRQSGFPAARKSGLSALLDLVRPGQMVPLWIDELAREAGVSYRTVSRTLLDLELAQVLVRVPQFEGRSRSGGIRSASLVRIDYPALWAWLGLSRAALREKLDQAFARVAVARSRRMAQLVAGRKNSNESRSATSAEIIEDISFPSLKGSGDVGRPGASRAESLAQLAASYIPVHLRRAS